MNSLVSWVAPSCSCVRSQGVMARFRWLGIPRLGQTKQSMENDFFCSKAQTNLTVVTDEEVFGFKVPVNYILGVAIFQRTRRLFHVLHRAAFTVANTAAVSS